MPDVQGNWSGKYSSGKYGKRPINLRIQEQSGDRITGEMDLLSGPQNWKTIPLAGRLSADGTIVLSDATTGWTIKGQVTGNTLAGTIRHPNLRKAMALNASRR